MKRYLKLRFVFILCLVLSLSFVHPFAVYADVNDLLIGTSSNAISTFGMPRSSIANVTNTVLWDSDVSIEMLLRNSSGTTLTDILTPANFTPSADGLSIKYSAPSGYSIYGYNVFLKNLRSDFLPPSGNYNMSVDVSSHFSHDYIQPGLWSQKLIDNATGLTSYDYLQFTESSGDLYIAPFVIEINNITRCLIQFMFNGTYSQVDFVIHVNFTKTSENASVIMPGSGLSDQDYQSDVSSSLSDLSSSVDSMTEDLSSAAESLEYISSSQNLIIQGIDNVIMHISDQLYAFWDQLYNLIHEPTMAKMDEIIEAIENVVLQIDVDLDELKTSINNMSQAVQNKLQSVQDGINNKLQSVQETLTNGFNNSGINQDAAVLDQSLQEYDEAEQNVLEQVNDSLNDFEFDGGFEEYANTIKVFSDFLQALYESSGGFKVVINLSLMLSIAGIVIGVYRFKQGG